MQMPAWLSGREARGGGDEIGDKKVRREQVDLAHLAQRKEESNVC